MSFASVVELIEARDRILAECHPPGSLWSDPSNANKRLLVLVNPAAGKGRGVEGMYERDVAPVLACLTSFRPRSAPASPAGGSGASPPPSPTPSPTGDSRVDVRVTARRGDAQTAVATLDLDAYAAVVCVGGDGTLAEIFNGLMSRRGDPDAASVAARFPIGVIPAGSGNAVAKSLAELHGEPCDRTSAALAVARGGLRPVDRAVVADPSGDVAMHSLLSLSWGFFADVDIESERFRWLGGLRFTLQALVRILFMRRYRATSVRFRPAETSEETFADSDAAGSDARHSPRVAARRAARSGATAGVAMASRPGWREITGDVQGVWALSLPWGAEDMFAAPAAGGVRRRVRRVDRLGRVQARAPRSAARVRRGRAPPRGDVRQSVGVRDFAGNERRRRRRIRGGGRGVGGDGEPDEGTRRGGGTGTGDVAHAVRRDQGGGDGGRGDGVRGGRGGGRRRRERRVRRSRDERRAVARRESEKCLHLVKLSHKTPACAVIRPRLS